MARDTEILAPELLASVVRHSVLKELLSNVRCGRVTHDPRAPEGAAYAVWIAAPEWLSPGFAADFYSGLLESALHPVRILDAAPHAWDEEYSGDQLSGYESRFDQPSNTPAYGYDVKLYLSAPDPRGTDALTAEAEWQLGMEKWCRENPPPDWRWLARLFQE